MGRKPSKRKPHRLPLTLIEPTRGLLEKLVDTGGYGNNPTEAARTIIMRHLQELDDKGKIKLFPPLDGDGKIDTNK
jgi:hypothetical protein